MYKAVCHETMLRQQSMHQENSVYMKAHIPQSFQLPLRKFLPEWEV